MTKQFIGVLWVAGLWIIACLVARAADAGWMLVQSSQTGGNLVLYVSPSGMKSVDRLSGVSMFTTGPDWKVTMYNDKSRTYYETTVSAWTASLERRGMRSRLEGATWRRGQQGNVAGLRAYEFVMDRPPPARPQAAGSGKMKPPPPVTGASYWVASDIQIPKAASALISKFYGVPDCQRVPLKLTISDGARANALTITTLKAQQVPVPGYVRPTGYALVRSDTEVFLDEESRREMNRLMSEMGK